mmetsp:Transcript_14997/g.17982  ORF Transcript_14997/g.17982 Transcript_14997/m.17982 type:complete len:241 (-) Transcript_14997:145-867(-)
MESPTPPKYPSSGRCAECMGICDDSNLYEYCPQCGSFRFSVCEDCGSRCSAVCRADGSNRDRQSCKSHLELTKISKKNLPRKAHRSYTQQHHIEAMRATPPPRNKFVPVEPPEFKATPKSKTRERMSPVRVAWDRCAECMQECPQSSMFEYCPCCGSYRMSVCENCSRSCSIACLADKKDIDGSEDLDWTSVLEPCKNKHAKKKQYKKKRKRMGTSSDHIAGIANKKSRVRKLSKYFNDL